MVVSSSLTSHASFNGVFSHTFSSSFTRNPRLLLPSSFSSLQSFQSSRKNLAPQRGTQHAFPIISASVKAKENALESSAEKIELPKGDMWSVHKFGGTCVGTSDRIKNVAEIVVSDNSERKLVVVSAMSKVTDMMYDLIHKAQGRDDAFLTALDAVLEKHTLTAKDLLEGDDLLSFLSKLHDDISNLKAMLRAIFIDS